MNIATGPHGRFVAAALVTTIVGSLQLGIAKNRAYKTQNNQR